MLHLQLVAPKLWKQLINYRTLIVMYILTYQKKIKKGSLTGVCCV